MPSPGIPGIPEGVHDSSQNLDSMNPVTDPDQRSDLEEILERVHANESRDFRWVHLRNLVIAEVSGPKVLDAGCGTGHMAFMLLSRGYDTTAVDASSSLTEYARSYLERAFSHPRVMCMDLADISRLGDSVYDSVVCLDVLEHVERDIEILANLKDVTRIGGTVILSVPAIPGLYGIRDRKIGHYRRYSRRRLVRVIREAGLDLEDLRYWNFLGLWPVIFFEKFLKVSPPESLRYAPERGASSLFRSLLTVWFSSIEHRFRFPAGLTLIAVCRRRD